MSTIIRAAFLLLLPSLASAQTAVERSLDELLAAQGTFCFPDPRVGHEGECLLLRPPLPNSLVLMDADHSECLVIDYAGIAARYLQERTGGAVNLGTAIRGQVLERVRPDGLVEIEVLLLTDNALAWVNDCRFGGSPALFGHTVTEVEGGAPADLGSSVLHFKFIVSTIGAPLPDLFRILSARNPGEQLVSATMSAQVSGVFREISGVPEGTPGRVTGINRANWDMGTPISHLPAQIVIVHNGK